MRIFDICLVCAALSVSTAAGAADGDTLVCKQGDTFVAGMARSWAAEGDAVVFVLRPDVDSATVAQTLNDRLVGIKATSRPGELTVQGLPVAALLDKLAALHLKADADPLSDLGGLGGDVVASRTPEGGGSIRAGKAMVMSDLGGASATPAADPKERLDVEVVRIERSAFPHVTLHLKVRHAAQSGIASAQLKAGATFNGAMVFSGVGNQAINWSDPANIRNLAAYYLAPGDKVFVHATAPLTATDPWGLDWLERPGVKLP